MALNAHITLRELKGMIDTVVEKKLPTFKTLMEMNPVAVARTSVNGAKLTAYENGYAVYEVDSAHTVMAVDRCGDYRYDFTDGTHQIVPAETFEDAEWSLRLLMEDHRSNRASTRWGRSGHRTGCRSRGCGYSKQSGSNGTEENFRLLAIPTDLKNRGM